MSSSTSALPILYSFRRCPYAIRSRMALAISNQDAEIREVSLRDKPQHMLDVGTQGTVPLLILPTHPEQNTTSQPQTPTIYEDSLDIMDWALRNNDPQTWLHNRHQPDLNKLIKINDGPFKLALDQYKYPSRFPESDAIGARERTIEAVSTLNSRLQHQTFLSGDRLGFFDAAIFPFIRQWFAVDPKWSTSLELPYLHHWHQRMITHPRFTTIMGKLRPWKPGDVARHFLETLI